MDNTLHKKLYELIDTIRAALEDIKMSTANADELQSVIHEGRKAVTEVLEQQLGGVSLEKQINISDIPDEDWLITARHIIDFIDAPFIPQNQYEVYFQQLFDFLINSDKERILLNIKTAFVNMKERDPGGYETFVRYFSDYPLWGTFDPVNGDFTTLEMRADVLKQHPYDFMWLYRRTEDYLSKRTLAAILINWLDIQEWGLRSVKSIFKDYWEPDIFPNNSNDVLVDLGAYVGDSIANYVNIYGTGYKKIYAYEISQGSITELRKNIEEWQLHDIDIRRKGAGAEHSYMYVKDNINDNSANSLFFTGEADSRVEIVPLDDDLEDIPTFIKMDIEGAEQGALRGCETIIREHHPKLAVCIYHGYEDIWKIPSMIYDMNNEYKFYLRHNGGNLIPTEFVLLCKDDTQNK